MRRMDTKKTARKQKKTTTPPAAAPVGPTVKQRVVDKVIPAAPPPATVDAPAPAAEPVKPRTYNNPSIGVRMKAEELAIIKREQEVMKAEFPHLSSVLELATTLRMLALEGAAARLRAREAKAGK